jgi:magnesium transporter
MTGQLDDSTIYEARVALDDLRDAWSLLDPEERAEAFRSLKAAEAEEFFESLSALDQAQIVLGLPDIERKLWVRSMAPDDLADVVQALPDEGRASVLALLDEPTRKELVALLAYEEDEAGGLMNTRYGRLRPEMSVDEAITYLRKQTPERVESIYYAYVLDQQSQLLGVVSFRQLIMAKGSAKVAEVMTMDLVTVPDEMDQEAVSRLFAQHSYLSLPVVDAQGRMKGVVTADDIVDVVREEATEDIQKIGGSAALEAPYLEVRFLDMIKARAVWLVVLFLGSMLTISAIRTFEGQLAKASVLTAFIAMIISSGGNCGSQASTLVIRAMALGELKMRDWWRVFVREASAGLVLGGILAALGLLRVVIWHHSFEDSSGEPFYGDHYILIGLTVAGSVIGVALWGTLVGALLPFLLKRVGLDPASASAPLVATLSDVTGILIFFSVASTVLSGTLL